MNEITDYIPEPKTPEKLTPEWWDRHAQASRIWREIGPNLDPACKLALIFSSAMNWSDHKEPKAEDFNWAIISFYRLRPETRTRLFNGWAVDDEYHRPREAWLRDILDMNRYPVLVMRSGERDYGSYIEMHPREALSRVELHIVPGTKREDVLAALGRFALEVSNNWGKLISDPQDNAGRDEKAERELLTPGGGQ